MIHLLFDKDQTRQSCEIAPTQETYVSLFVEIYCITSQLHFVCQGSKFGFSQAVAVKISFSFRFIWLIMSAKRTYTEVVAGDEHTPTSFPGSLFFPYPGARERDQTIPGSLSLSLSLQGTGRRETLGTRLSILQMTAKAGCELASRKAKKTPLETILHEKKIIRSFY